MKHPNRSLWYLAHQQVVASRPPTPPEPKYRTSQCMEINDWTCDDCPAPDWCKCLCHGQRLTTPA